MAIDPVFPPTLLLASDDERVNYFASEVIVDHPALDRGLSSLNEKATRLLEKRLILLLGGAGVGKTALMRKLVKRRLARKAKASDANAQIVPAVFYEVEAPDVGKFAFSSLYRGFLAEIGAVLIERTLPIVERSARHKLIRTIGVEQAARRLDANALKERFIQNLIDREIELACFDEAINIFKVGTTRSESDRKLKLKEQADKLKTFGNKTPTSLVLAGAYDFFDLTLVSAQIARRSAIVHFEPYAMTKDGLSGFAIALVGLLAHLPVEHQLDPECHAVELFLQSLGCVGNLKNILCDGLLKALQRGKTLTIDLLRECYFTAAQLDVMRTEMEAGIKRVRELMSMEQLATNAAQASPTTDTPSTPTRGKKLAPGETAPSHRYEAAKNWGEE